MLDRSFTETVRSLGVDGERWQHTFAPHARNWDDLVEELSGPLVHVPRHPFTLGRFGLPALMPATAYTRARFREPRAKALFMGMAAHSMLPLTHPATASFALVLGAAGHAVGWPAIRGGSQRMTDVLAAIVREHGGELVTDAPVTSLADLPNARAVFLDTSPYAALRIAGDRLDPRVRRSLAKFRRGPAAFKLDYALSEPLPWKASDCARAGTVHIGGPAEEIVAAEAEVARGGHPERPFMLVAQQSIFDPTRAPAGRHTLWAYCHVPNGSTVDMTDRIEAQLERFAPGFRDVVLARNTLRPADFEARNPNKVGGDIGGGALTGLQFVSRPRPRARPVPPRGGRLPLLGVDTAGRRRPRDVRGGRRGRVLAGTSSATETRDHPQRWSGTRPIMAAWGYRTSRPRRVRSPWAAGRSTSSRAPARSPQAASPGTCSRHGPGRSTSRSSTPTAAARSSRCATTTGSR